MSKALQQKLDQAQSYTQWKEAALAWDRHHGLTNWKNTERTRLYDYAAIRDRFDTLKQCRENNDNQGLLFTLNEGIHGNLCGIGGEQLYQQAKFGTKELINNYVNEVSSALEHLAKSRLKGVSAKQQTDFFQRASLCFGRSALTMSGSGTFLFFHVGVLKALWQENLLPQVISGASGGAFVAAAVGTRSPKEVAKVFSPELIDLESDMRAVLRKMLSIRKKKQDVKHKDLEYLVTKLIPDLTFAEACEVSGLAINVSITPAEAHQKSRLLNAITSPNVMVREAVMASCSIPGVFSPVTLQAKNVHGEKVPYLPNRKWVDGSLSDDLPMKRISRLYGVNHFIVSQTNPIVLPFISAEKSSGGVFSTLGQTSLKTAKDWGLAAGYLLQKPFKADSYMSKLLNGYISVVSQTYTGDINILPESRFLNPAKAVSPRSNQEIENLIEEGERAAWPHIERIRIQTKISRTLTQIQEKFSKRLLKSEQTGKLKAVK